MSWPKTSRHLRGYGSAWDMLRRAVLVRDGHLCQCAACRAEGRTTVATEVDHIVPKSKGGTDRLSNLQAIGRECHLRKTIAESGGEYHPPVEVGLDGWPKPGGGGVGKK